MRLPGPPKSGVRPIASVDNTRQTANELSVIQRGVGTLGKQMVEATLVSAENEAKLDAAERQANMSRHLMVSNDALLQKYLDSPDLAAKDYLKESQEIERNALQQVTTNASKRVIQLLTPATTRIKGGALVEARMKSFRQLTDLRATERIEALTANAAATVFENPDMYHQIAPETEATLRAVEFSNKTVADEYVRKSLSTLTTSRLNGLKRKGDFESIVQTLQDPDYNRYLSPAERETYHTEAVTLAGNQLATRTELMINRTISDPEMGDGLLDTAAETVDYFNVDNDPLFAQEQEALYKQRVAMAQLAGFRLEGEHEHAMERLDSGYYDDDLTPTQKAQQMETLQRSLSAGRESDFSQFLASGADYLASLENGNPPNSSYTALANEYAAGDLTDSQRARLNTFTASVDAYEQNQHLFEDLHTLSAEDFAARGVEAQQLTVLGAGESPEGQAALARVQTSLVNQMSSLQRAKMEDAATYSIRSSPTVQALWQDAVPAFSRALMTGNVDDVAAARRSLSQYMSASQEEQIRQGVPEQFKRFLPKDGQLAALFAGAAEGTETDIVNLAAILVGGVPPDMHDDVLDEIGVTSAPGLVEAYAFQKAGLPVQAATAARGARVAIQLSATPSPSNAVAEPLTLVGNALRDELKNFPHSQLADSGAQMLEGVSNYFFGLMDDGDIQKLYAGNINNKKMEAAIHDTIGGVVTLPSGATTISYRDNYNVMIAPDKAEDLFARFTDGAFGDPNYRTATGAPVSLNDLRKHMGLTPISNGKFYVELESSLAMGDGALVTSGALYNTDGSPAILDVNNLRANPAMTPPKDTTKPLGRLGLNIDVMDIGSSARAEAAALFKHEGGDDRKAVTATGQHVVYDDGRGNLTAGVGHKLTSEELKQYDKGDIIPASTVQKWFEADLATAEKDANTFTSGMEKTPPPEVQQVLTNLAFNMGGARFTKAKWPKFWEAISTGRYYEASRELLLGNDGRSKSNYAKQVGRRATDLASRLTAVGG